MTMAAVDRFVHTNPAFVALALRWMCGGYEEVAGRRESATGRLAFTWGLAGLALLGPDRVRSALPSTSNKRLSNLMEEHPQWRASLPDAVSLWAPAFWQGLAFALGTGVLGLHDGRLEAREEPKRPSSEFAVQLRKTAIALGKIMAHESGDQVLAAILGVEVTT